MPKRDDAVEILSVLAAADPIGFRDLVRAATGKGIDSVDALTAAVAATEFVTACEESSPVGSMRRRFMDHLLYLDTAPRTAGRLADALAPIVRSLGVELLDRAAEGDTEAQAVVRAWMQTHEERIGGAASALLGYWPLFRHDDTAASRDLTGLSYFEVGSHPSALGIAATAAGMRPADDGASADLLLATLPFSAFVGPDGSDPAVEERIAEAALMLRSGGIVLFRTDWTAATRMRMRPKNYILAVAERFPEHEVRAVVVRNKRSVPMKGSELFVGVARRWNDEFTELTVGPRRAGISEIVGIEGDAEGVPILDRSASMLPHQIPDRIQADYRAVPAAGLVEAQGGLRRLTEAEVASTPGIREDGGTGGVDLHPAMASDAAVPVVERAIRGLLRAAALD